MKKHLASLVLCLGLALRLEAAPPPQTVITWYGQNTVDSIADIIKSGVFVAAEGSRSGSVTANGVTFAAQGTSNQISFGSANWTGDTGFGSGSVSPTGNTNFDLMLRSGYYTPSNDSATITLSGLTLGTQYRVQVFVGTWDANYPTTLEYGSAYIDMLNSRDVATTAYGFFTAEATSVSFDFSGTGSGEYGIVSAVSLYAIPEPSTYAAAAGALALGFACYRRRRHA